MMLKLKNVSGQVQQIHTYEFPVDGEYEIDNSWYIPQVIEAVVNGIFEIYLNESLIEGVDRRLNALRGDVHLVELSSPKDGQGSPIFTTSPFSDAGGLRFRGASFKGTALANSVTDLDYSLPAERFINGGRIITTTVGDDDSLTVQVVDSLNLFGLGADTVLDEFISNYYIPTNGNLEVRLDYPARLLQGLVLRFKYNNSESVDKEIKVNLYLHMKES